MNLLQEYAARHQIKTPLIVRPRGRSMLLCYANNKNNCKWTLWNIDTEMPGGQPPYYQFRLYQPHHNIGLTSSNVFTLLPSSIKVEWDDYEKEIIKFIKKHELKPIKDFHVAELTMWEIFMYTSDSFLNSLPYGAKRLAYNIIDTELSIQERLDCRNKCLHILSSQRNWLSLYHRFEHLNNHLNKNEYLYWLADLIALTKDSKDILQILEEIY